jgi:hypothetical protein
MARPAGVGDCADGRISAIGGVNVLRSDAGDCLAGLSVAVRRAELSRDRAGIKLSGSSGTRKVFSTSWGRESTAFDGLRSTVSMVARSALPGSESVSESLRYFAI